MKNSPPNPSHRRRLTRHAVLWGAILSSLAGSAGVSWGQTTYYWDINKAVAGTGGTGNWGTAAANDYWTFDGIDFGLWTNSSSNIATFGGSPGSVSLTTSFTVHSLRFYVSGYLIDSGSSTTRTITLGSGEVYVGSGTATHGPKLKLSGSSGFNKTGGGELIIQGASDYSGATTISEGKVTLGVTDALKASSNLTVNFGATLDVGGLSQSTTSGVLSGAGLITSSSSDGEYHFGSTTDSDFSGVLSGQLSLFKDGGSSSTLTLSGSSANTFSGATSVTVGDLELNKTGVNAISGSSLIIGDNSGDDRVILSQSNQIGDSVAVTVNSGALLDIGTNSDVIGSLSGSGTVDMDGNGSFTFGGNGNATVFSGNVSATSTGSVTKLGGGDFTLETGGSVSGGTVTISGGTFEVQTGATLTGVSSGTLTVDSGATLAGEGAISGKVTIDGTYAPGADGIAGSQAITGNLSFKSNSIFEWDLNANADDSGFDTVAVTGTIEVSETDTVFSVVFGDAVDMEDVFWSTPYVVREWSMASIFGEAFSSGAFQIVETSDDISSYGSFSIDGTNLTWTAVPEPSSAVAGLLLGAGLLRRKR